MVYPHVQKRVNIPDMTIIFCKTYKVSPWLVSENMISGVFLGFCKLQRWLIMPKQLVYAKHLLSF